MGAATGRATGGSKEVGTGADSQCPQRGTFTVVGDGFVRVALVNIHIYIYTRYTFYPQTLGALPHDCMPSLERGTRSRISARFMAPGDETPRARQGGAPRAGVPSSGARPSQNGT